MKAEDKAKLAQGLAFASVLCCLLTAVPSLLLASAAMKELPKESPGQRQARIAMFVSIAGVALWMVVGIINMVLDPNFLRFDTPDKGGKVRWEDLQIGREYKLMKPAVGFDRPGDQGEVKMKLPAGEPVEVVEKFAEKLDWAKRDLHWVKVTTVQLYRGKKGNVVSKDVQLWLEEPELEPWVMSK